MGVRRLEELFPRDFFETDLIGLSEKEKIAMKTIEISKDDYFIDLDKILNALNISVQKGFYHNHSGQIDSENRVIYLNSMEPDVRQRFTIAHEIGHYALNHSGISNRLKNPEDIATVDIAKERSANQFAAELLMPKKLIARCITKFQQDNNLTDEQLVNANVDEFIDSLSSMMRTSKQSTTFRLQNLGVITY